MSRPGALTVNRRQGVFDGADKSARLEPANHFLVGKTEAPVLVLTAEELMTMGREIDNQ
jgi:hypothetical protein